MPSHEFWFSIEHSGPEPPSALLHAIVAHALGFTREPAGAPGVLAELDRVVSGLDAEAAGRIRLDVRSAAGRLEIVVTPDRGPVWRTSRPLA